MHQPNPVLHRKVIKEMPVKSNWHHAFANEQFQEDTCTTVHSNNLQQMFYQEC